jgi:hypothetical protein
MTEQAFRYAKDSWTAAEAKAHCKDHEGSTFEPASDDEAAFVVPELEAVCEIDQRGIQLDSLRYLHGYTVEGIRYHQPKDAGENAMLVFDARRHEDNPDQLARRLAAALVEGKHLSGSAVSSLLAMLAPLKAQAEVDMDNALARMAESELAALLN